MIMFQCTVVWFFNVLKCFQNVKNISVGFECDSPPPLGKFRSQGLATLVFTAFLKTVASM